MDIESLVVPDEERDEKALRQVIYMALLALYKSHSDPKALADALNEAIDANPARPFGARDAKTLLGGLQDALSTNPNRRR